MDIKNIQNLLEKKLLTFGYDLVSINSKFEKGTTYLEVVVDRVEPIDMDAITKISEVISSYLDEIDNTDEPYTLNVSSLGAEKPLRIDALNNYVDRYVNVHVINPIDGENIFEGYIREVNQDSFTLEIRIKTRVKTLVILLSNIYKIRLAIKF